MENTETLQQAIDLLVYDFHEKALQMPYILAKDEGALASESVIGHLRVLSIVYGTLEHQLSQLNHPEINAFWKGCTPMLPDILAQLDKVYAKVIRDIIPTVNLALSIADKILLYSVQHPYKLIGFRLMLDRLHNVKMDPENYNQLAHSNKDEVLIAAKELSDDLLRMYESLHPIDFNQLGNHITALNPEAGNFPIPTNPIEIEAAITAGKTCWNDFSYYEKRYGERGRRFTTSDSVWLVTLIELSEDLAFKQALWLAKYLTTRGMPVITMEYHLKYLYEELVKQLPENQAKYNTLLVVSKKLETLRLEKVSAAIFEQSNALFLRFCEDGEVKDEPLRNTGLLIAGTIADSLNGMDDSMIHFKSWMTNPELFSANWIQVVEKTYAELLDQLNS